LASKDKDFTSAIRDSAKGQKIAEEFKFTEHQAHFLDQIGGDYSMLGQHKKGLEYLLRALEIARTSGDKMRVAVVLDNIGINNNKTKEYEQAKKYFEEALVMA